MAPANTTSPARSKRTLQNYVIPPIILLIIGCAWTFVAFAEIKRMSPPTPNASLSQFAASMPPPKRLALIEIDGAQRLVWIGQTGHWSLPSGPSCYLFDSQGKLLDWVWETGEGGFIDPWCAKTWASTHPLTIPQALELTTGK